MITKCILFTLNIMTIIKVYTSCQKLLPTYWGICMCMVSNCSYFQALLAAHF